MSKKWAGLGARGLWGQRHIATLCLEFENDHWAGSNNNPLRFPSLSPLSYHSIDDRHTTYIV